MLRFVNRMLRKTPQLEGSLLLKITEVLACQGTPDPNFFPNLDPDPWILNTTTKYQLTVSWQWESPTTHTNNTRSRRQQYKKSAPTIQEVGETLHQRCAESPTLGIVVAWRQRLFVSTIRGVDDSSHHWRGDLSKIIQLRRLAESTTRRVGNSPYQR
jgi:hypothetical protein